MNPVRLETERLLLRPFVRTDAAEFARLAGDWAVASMTSDIPYPFSPAQAEGWLKPARGEVRFAVERQGKLIGGVGYYRRASGAAELGFWLGRPFWGSGYATEAGRAVVSYGFAHRRVPGFSSSRFVDNAASARVLEKLGFEPVGRGTIACAARGRDVETVGYWLDREHAKLTLPSLTVSSDTPRPRWRSWLNLLSGA
jgi:[ribosomal protein S5]-alanine N-acetyltransferase